MYLKFYGMRENPFGVTPNPHYLYLSPQHREALASLIYGIETRRGFMALIAKPGMGKTTLLFELLERLRATARTVFLFQTQCDSREFLRYLLSDMGINAKDEDLVGMHDQLNQALVAEARAGRGFVLFIDEAQNLTDSVLETVRLLSDFETPRAKLMQIVLAGQPQLAERLALPSLVQLRQRISVLARLEPLSQKETQAYVDHRLKVAGYAGPALFTREAVEMIAARAKGIPRNINNICFNALSSGFARQSKQIDSDIVQQVFADLNVNTLIEEVSDVSVTRAIRQPICRDLQPAAQELAWPAPEVAGAPHLAKQLANSGQEVAGAAHLPEQLANSERKVTGGVPEQLANSGRELADAANLPKQLANRGRSALRLGAVAVTIFLAVCLLIFLPEKLRIKERLPVAQTVSASNDTRPAPSALSRVEANQSPRASAEPAEEKRHARNTRTVPHKEHPVQKATRPLQVRTVLPDVTVIQPELAYSLKPPDEAISGPGPAQTTTTGGGAASLQRVRVGGQAQAAKLVFQPAPEYPPLARTARVQGTVRLEVVVAKDGSVEKLHVLSGHPLLVEAAEAAVERWRYQPTLLNGSPIEVVTEVDVDFAF
jgi:TonB family protein